MSRVPTIFVDEERVFFAQRCTDCGGLLEAEETGRCEIDYKELDFDYRRKKLTKMSGTKMKSVKESKNKSKGLKISMKRKQTPTPKVNKEDEPRECGSVRISEALIPYLQPSEPLNEYPR